MNPRPPPLPDAAALRRQLSIWTPIYWVAILLVLGPVWGGALSGIAYFQMLGAMTGDISDAASRMTGCLRLVRLGIYTGFGAGAIGAALLALSAPRMSRIRSALKTIGD